MKKTMLCGALFTLMCSQMQAEAIQQPVQQMPGAASAPVQNQPTEAQVAPQGAQNAQPAQAQPEMQQPAQNTSSVPPQSAPTINCNYKIPAETKTIDQSLVITWAEKATTQAFDFDPASVDSQVQKLQSCFTEQGWTGFSSALVKSGNVEAIKSQKLTVSSELDGQIQVTEAKNNQWKMTLPLHVVYQNDKEKVTQLLNVQLTVGRKINGDLGIMQMIASPRTAVTAQPNAVNATPSVPEQPSTANPTAPNTPEDTGTAPVTTANPVPSSGPATPTTSGTNQ